MQLQNAFHTSPSTAIEVCHAQRWPAALKTARQRVSVGTALQLRGQKAPVAAERLYAHRSQRRCHSVRRCMGDDAGGAGEIRDERPQPDGSPDATDTGRPNQQDSSGNRSHREDPDASAEPAANGHSAASAAPAAQHADSAESSGGGSSRSSSREGQDAAAAGADEDRRRLAALAAASGSFDGGVESVSEVSDSALESELQSRWRRLQALEDYREHMLHEDAKIDLLECALLIAKHAYPDLDEGMCRHDIELLADGVLDTLPEDPAPLRIVKAINYHLYDVHGFHGNRLDFHSPQNSCLNKVLENRAGIPITLALIYQLVAQRCGLPMVGINLPGHFMLAPAVDDLEVLVDAFNGGEVCFLEEAADRLANLHGIQPGMVVIDPKVVRNKEESAITPRRFLARMLHNLKTAYIKQRRPDMTIMIIQYLRATVPDLYSEIRDEGLCLYALERHAECAELLREYLAAEPDAGDRGEVEALLTKLRRIDIRSLKGTDEA